MRRAGPRPAALLRGAVEIPSPSGAEGAVADFLVAAMREHLDEAFVDEAGNAVGLAGRGPGRLTVLGHIDTVPGPVPVRLEHGRLYGRGAVDAKGPFVAAVCAAARLSPEARERLTVRLVGAVEEEAPSSRGARHAVAAYERPDWLVIAEPSGWDGLTFGYKGRLRLRLEVDREEGHSAAEGPTAGELLVEGWLRLRAWAEGAAPPGAGLFDRVQGALLELRAGSDGLRQHGAATVSLRLPPAWPPERAAAELGALDWPGAARLTVLDGERAHRADRDSSLARAFRAAIRSAGGRPRPKLKTGTSDMNVVADRWDAPVLAYGPGDSRLDHTPDEHLRIEELERAVEVLTDAFERLTRGGGPPRCG